MDSLKITRTSFEKLTQRNRTRFFERGGLLVPDGTEGSATAGEVTARLDTLHEVKTLSRAEFDALPQDQRAAFSQGGGTIGRSTVQRYGIDPPAEPIRDDGRRSQGQERLAEEAAEEPAEHPVSIGMLRLRAEAAAARMEADAATVHVAQLGEIRSQLGEVIG
jgi:hypothetical protein